MAPLLLQKPSSNSKSKDHLASLERRLKLWEEEDMSNLYEGEKGMNIEKISLKFENIMSKETSTVRLNF